MINFLYSVCDIKVRKFGPLMQLRSDGEALRLLSEAVNRKEKDNNLTKYPEDFVLLRLGTMDDETGEIVQDEKINVANVINLLNVNVKEGDNDGKESESSKSVEKETENFVHTGRI